MDPVAILEAECNRAESRRLVLIQLIQRITDKMTPLVEQLAELELKLSHKREELSVLRAHVERIRAVA